MGVPPDFLAASMACVGLLTLTLAAGFYLLFKQQRGEKRIDPPLEEIRAQETEIRRMAKDLELARRDDARARKSWFSFGPHSTTFNIDPEDVSLVGDKNKRDNDASTSLRSTRSSPRSLPMRSFNHENDTRGSGARGAGVGGFMDLEQFPDPSQFNGASPRLGSSNMEEPDSAGHISSANASR